MSYLPSSAMGNLPPGVSQRDIDEAFDDTQEEDFGDIFDTLDEREPPDQAEREAADLHSQDHADHEERGPPGRAGVDGQESRRL